jgi:two-component system LytT family response regulator
MYKVILIDDEQLSRELLKTYLAAYTQLTVVAECADGFAGFKAIQEHHPDLIFLDIQMPRLTGFEMLELIDQPPAVIFTTAFDEYAIKAFEANAIDYLLKPFVKDRFNKAVDKWMATAGTATPVTPTLKLDDIAPPDAYQHRIVVKYNNTIRIIPEAEIQYLEANDDYVKIVTADGSYLKKCTLSHLEQTLDPQVFARVHRSYMIPVNQLQRIEPYEKDSHIALLHCGAKVMVSKNGLSKLKNMLGW